jgi:hypothetical protein
MAYTEGGMSSNQSGSFRTVRDLRLKVGGFELRAEGAEIRGDKYTLQGATLVISQGYHLTRPGRPDVDVIHVETPVDGIEIRRVR